MPRDILQFINELIVQFCESPVSSPITWCLGIIWIIKSIYALYKILYLIFDYPHKHYTFKYFEV